ncbi:MAG: DNA replication/repair protein RecF [Chlamydiales bacterium]|nr:DNA replication/repair protein RecF [Chlamydiales bacterium]
MRIEKVVLWHFRNYESVTFSFKPEVNLIRGENAQGKTNLLEALFFLCTGKSFRTHHLADFIPYGKPFFHVETHYVKDGVSGTIKASFDGQTRKLYHNSTPFSSFSHLLGLIPIVLISPQDLALVAGTPTDRRRFIDMHLAQSDPLYVHHLGRYLKAVKQRNALLKQNKEESLEAWERVLATSASYILERRSACLKQLLPIAQASLLQLTDGADELDLHYQPTLPEECPWEPEAIYNELRKSRRRELAAGMTLIGPHRDDLLILINGKEAKSFASEGQKRGAVTALRLSEWQSLKENTGYAPLLGIDDFGIHLDAKRYALVQQQIQGLGQVFLTTPNPTDPTFLCNATILIHSGSEISVEGALP